MVEDVILYRLGNDDASGSVGFCSVLGQGNMECKGHVVVVFLGGGNDNQEV